MPTEDSRWNFSTDLWEGKQDGYAQDHRRSSVYVNEAVAEPRRSSVGYQSHIAATQNQFHAKFHTIPTSPTRRSSVAAQAASPTPLPDIGKSAATVRHHTPMTRHSIGHTAAPKSGTSSSSEVPRERAGTHKILRRSDVMKKLEELRLVLSCRG